MMRGQTCTLVWRRLVAGAAATDVHPARTRSELFLYVVRGDIELTAANGVQRVTSGSLIVIPGAEPHVRLRTAGTADAALAEFSPERR
jgi:quercetin dioxygenase-like cupin family protein